MQYMKYGRDIMLSIPQYLDFAYTGKTKEICDFFLELLQRKSEALYLHSQQVANYSVRQTGALPEGDRYYPDSSVAARHRPIKRSQQYFE